LHDTNVGKDDQQHESSCCGNEQKWVVSNATTINGDVANEPLYGHQWYQKGPSGKRITPGNPNFADMSWVRMQPTMTQAEGNKLGEGKNNNQPSMGAV
jgi:hypothetical protein